MISCSYRNNWGFFFFLILASLVLSFWDLVDGICYEKTINYSLEVLVDFLNDKESIDKRAFSFTKISPMFLTYVIK